MCVRLGFTPDEQSGWEMLKGLIGDQICSQKRLIFDLRGFHTN